MANPEVLASITTPLALAALCLLGGTGILRAVAHQKPNAAIRLVIHWGFILSLALGVLANISYITIASFGREIRVAGSIRDDAGRPLGRAIIDIPGRGRGVTNDSGTFELTIPDSRKADIYEGNVFLDGYGSKDFTLQGPVPKKAVSITLQRPKLEAMDLILPADAVSIGHYLGMPIVNARLRFFNPMPFKIHLEGIALNIIAPNGEEHQLPMLGTYQPLSGQFVSSPLPTLWLEPSQSWDLVYKFGRFDSAVYELIADAHKEYGPAMPPPAIGQLIFSESLAQRFHGFMAKTMLWTPGQWRLAIRTMVNGRELAREFPFALTQENINRLQSVSRHYRTGYSTLPMLPDAPDGRSHVMVNIR